ncbi:MAG: MFS transporter [Chelatococcus sp.]|nr:MAG: MFS transporter [Chelatococcus sp.]
MSDLPSERRGLGALRRSPAAFLMSIAFINLLGYASWAALINNFAKEAAGFTGQDIGILQSVREIPGFLAFTAIILFWVMREQILAYLSLATLGVGVALTGYFPTLGGLLATTMIMSLGFHYYETAQQSLQLQLLSKKEAPRIIGRIAGASAMAQLIAFGTIAVVWRLFQPGYATVFTVSGIIVTALAVAAWLFFPRFQGSVPQNKGFVMRRRYWLYYALTFMTGARRQIFMAFGGFLLVERFGYDVSATALLLLATYGINMVVGPMLGTIVARLGERGTIQFESVSLIVVFIGYALASHGHFGASGATVAGALFVVDGVFFTLTLAQRTYFQKIADPADIAPTAAVAFTINHIAAVALPVTFGLIWLWDPAFVFVIGAGVATISLSLAFLVPRHPEPGRETTRTPALPAAAE